MVSMTTSSILSSESKRFWINLNQILNCTYSFYKNSRSRFPPFPGKAASNFPSFPVGKFHFPSGKTEMQFFNSHSLLVKRECDFQFPFPFPGAKKTFLFIPVLQGYCFSNQTDSVENSLNWIKISNFKTLNNVSHIVYLHVSRHVHLQLGHYVNLHVGHHVHLHVGHHIGHHNVILTLCEGWETLTEKKFESITDVPATGVGARDACASRNAKLFIQIASCIIFLTEMISGRIMDHLMSSQCRV